MFLLCPNVTTMKIKAVLFDMGKTLIQYNYGSPHEVFQRILTAMKIPKPLQAIKSAFLNAQKEAEKLGILSSFGKVGCEEYWHNWDSLVLKNLGVANNEELANIVQSKWFDFVGCTPYPEVKEVLLELKRRGLKLGLISNGYEEEIDFVLEKANLDKTTFDIIVGVDTTKKVKPSPDVFRYALGRLNVKPDVTLFVGDHIEMDYDGARAVGINALLIEREDTPTDRASNERIRNLQEIFRFMD